MIGRSTFFPTQVFLVQFLHQRNKHKNTAFFMSFLNYVQNIFMHIISNDSSILISYKYKNAGKYYFKVTRNH